MSDLNLIANRYVDALFSLAGEQKLHDAVQKDMLTLQAAFEQSAELKRFVINPIISREVAEQAVASLTDAVKACDLTKKFFALLARERRLEVAPVAIQKYLSLLAESRGELSVQVTSAKPLSEQQVKTLADSLSKTTGKKVTMKTAENPALIGGVQVRVGSTLLDNSVAGKLARVRLALTKAA